MMRTISKTKEPTLRSLLHLAKVSRFYAANFTSFKVEMVQSWWSSESSS